MKAINKKFLRNLLKRSMMDFKEWTIVKGTYYTTTWTDYEYKKRVGNYEVKLRVNDTTDCSFEQILYHDVTVFIGVSKIYEFHIWIFSPSFWLFKYLKYIISKNINDSSIDVDSPVDYVREKLGGK